MALYRTVVLIVISLLVNVDTLSTCVFAQVKTKSHLTHWDKSSEGRSDTEVRAGNIFSKVSNFVKENNVIRWADASKSDDFVKKKLKLNGLSGDALTGHKNYKFFEQFVSIKQSNQLNEWLKVDTSTFAVWRELGLGNINSWDDLMNAADTDAFKLYQRYADSFDNHALINAVFENKPMPVLSADTSWTERIARMVNWEANNKAEVYVMGALGFHILSPAAIEANRNDKTFLVYWLLKNHNPLNAAQQNTKDILKKLMELENLPPAELALLKNQMSLNDARHDTKVLLKKLLGLNNLSPAEMASHDKYQTFLYLYGLIKKQKQQQIDEQVSNLMQRLTPRLR